MKTTFIGVFLLCTYQLLYSQQIITDESFSQQQLIEQIVQGCVQTSNVTSYVNGASNDIISYAYFERGSSNFPFENGLVLTTGSTANSGTPVVISPLNLGDNTWGTDPDLETTLDVNNTLNATSIEFDFISVTNQISFNYVLASEEYFANYPCHYSDRFAFLIRPAGSTEPYTNIAVVPGTDIPVSTSVIHDEIVGFCPAENEEYFAGYNLGDTNYNGRTNVLTAEAILIPNQQYHVKLIIADGGDENFDSAVFIEGNSFNANVNLGNDIVSCANSYTLNADIGNPLATYTWYLNDSIIPNTDTITYTATYTGTYQVQITIPVGTSTCTISDTIEVTLNSAQSAEPIADYELCDDSSQDGIEIFDLSIKTNEILEILPVGTYDISYHLSQQDAENNANPVGPNITNVSCPQEIFVRILDSTNGCLVYTRFNLVVNPLLQINDPTPMIVLDNNTDGITEIDLTISNDTITNMNSNYIVSYHYTQVDADNNTNPILTNYTNAGTQNIVFIRVEDTTTGCYIITTLDITVYTPPILNLGPSGFDPNSPNPSGSGGSGTAYTIGGCDPDHDGFATFNLIPAINTIVGELVNVTITVHTLLDDSLSGINPILDVTSFDNTTIYQQLLYIRVEDNISGAFSLASIEVHSNLLLTATVIDDIDPCDDDSNDGIESFDFTTIADDIANDLENITITFYTSADDRDNAENSIDTNVPFTNTSNPQEIFITLTNADGCEEIESFNLIVNPNVSINAIGTLNYCDNNDDGVTYVDLTTFDSVIQDGNTSFNVAYFLTMANANSAQNSISQFTNTTNPQEIFVRLTNPDTNCYDVSSFRLEVLPAPTVTVPSPIIICDDDTDGVSIMDLTIKIPEIIPDTNNINIGFFATASDAFENANEITNTANYQSASTTLYSRVENVTTGCFAVLPLEIIVNTIPNIVATDIYQLCEIDTDQTEGFILQTQDAGILNGQTDRTVYYFTTEQDAIDRTNSIDKNAQYHNISNPQTIYYRIENDTDQDCYTYSSLVIQVSPASLFNEPADWFVCDDASNDGIETFDLNVKVQEITQGISQNLTVQFYLTEDNADTDTNAVATTFTNINNPQAIYARITNDSDCYIITEFELNVIQVPETNSAPDITVCDVDYDGIATFDLTTVEFEILNIRQDNVVITYHEIQNDAETGINPIVTPSNYSNSNDSQTIYVRVYNTISQCYVIVPFVLNVNLPPTINEIDTATFCEAEQVGTVDLSQLNTMIVDDTSVVNLSYYISSIDADAGSNTLPSIYTRASNPETIYVRVEDSTTGCHIVTNVDIVINPNPIANQPDDLEECTDDNANTVQVFDLSQQNTSVLDGQNPVTFEVSYHSNIEDAESGVGDLPFLYNAFNEQAIYARVENIDTGCYATTSFMTIIRPLPIIDIPDEITLCLNDLPLSVTAGTDSGNTYQWSTGATTATTDINVIGNYSVIVTSQYGCQETKSFTVNESELVTIVDVDVVNFSENNTITITVSGIGNYLYTLDDGEPQVSNIFENVNTGYHIVTVSDVNGCGEVKEEVVVMDYITFFTPNNDSYNDTWHIIGIEKLPNSIVYIFDRYGKLLKTLKASDLGWDGLYRGQRMPSNDYWFLAEIKDGKDAFQVKGHFSLKR